MGILKRVYRFVGSFSLLNKRNKILILGLDKAGKSTLLKELARRRPGGFQHILHPTSEELVIQDVRYVAINYGGQQQGRPLWSDHLNDVVGILFLVDVADHKRFGEVKAELDALLATNKMQKIPIVVLGNKIDHLYAVSEEELCYELGLERICGRPIKLCMCSLALRQGYGEALRWLAHHI
ncbi:GTP-binding protein SAR1 [Annulohypoxylon truncatum]|uniref:GTP-binding protein SAR1 n=1 Tax=Annulohypoxylon truncatum TaxID=327061 RepID=UPI0020076001|nr:GTP-binding protein SAR1 [Annulohypoxylon truncatum]KAI1211948.1 GTP-binding protein SAR1 [Annulohypoxylon truncatum]